MSVLTNPNAMSVVGANILAPQNAKLQAENSKKEAAAALAASSANNSDADIIRRQVQASIASQISQSIVGSNGSPASGVFSLGDGQTISYDRNGATTSVTILGSNGMPINLSFPTIQ
jgi:tripartite-type tricarboxylate transporter receptor subunit TctC